jgi:parallel beta-helix repeat protein/predicted outer membrane repeat protein
LEDRLAPAVIAVTSLADSGANTLRAALSAASLTPEDDTININVTGTILLTSGELKIPAGVTVNGPVSGNIVVNGNGLSRVFNTSDAPAGGVININRVSIVNGSVTGNGAGLFIGDESVTLTNCTFSNNKATGDGGGIHVNTSAGVLNLFNCFLTGNQALGTGNDGGAISFLSAGTMVMDKCTVTGNLAADDGGGIYFRLGGKFTITNSTISNNVAGSDSASIGGGLYFFGTATGPLVLQNCTISANSSGGAGGGIVLASFSGSLNLVSCTVVKNSATSTGITGGGIARLSGTGAVGMTSTIVAGNTSQSGNGPDVSFNAVTNVTGDGNLIGVADSGNAIFDAATNQLGTKASPIDAKLGLLAYNGGPTPTHRPLSGSPVIDKGVGNTAFDQRGVSRVVGDAADVGAVEFATSFFVTNTNDSGAGSLRRAIEDSNLDLGIFNGINFDAAAFATPQTIKLTSGELSITEGTSINGLGKVTIDANWSSRHFNINGPGTLVVGIFNMTLTKGNGQALDGGSIFIADENVILQNVTITNSTTTGKGGGIAAGPNANVTLNNCVVSNNSVTGFFSAGGGIRTHSSKLTVQSSRITGNSATEDGGGIYFNAGGTLSITDSTIDANVSNTNWFGSGGGGVYFFGTNDGGGLTVLNSTISGNSAGSSSSGGGITLAGIVDNAVIRNSTITGNSAANKGGGIHRYGSAGTLVVESSIIAGNSANNGSKSISMPGTVQAIRSALDSVDGINNLSLDSVSNSLFAADLKLGPLSDNGGPWPTHLPAPDSPLIGKGSNPASLQYDQRGTGYLRERSGAADIGAVEAKTNLVVTNNNNAGAGSLRQAVLDANNLVGFDVITFDPTFFGSAKTITLTSGEMSITEAVAIFGPGAKFATVSGNNSSRIFNSVFAPSGSAITIAGLTLSNGKAANHGGAILGGDEHIVLQNCVFTGNAAPSGSGGAVAVFYGGKLTATDCTFSSNAAHHYGGAIITRGGGFSELNLNRSTVSGNQANAAGGIYMYRNGLIENSTISGNTATGILGNGHGGGVYLATPLSAVTFTIRNSTISGNKAQSNGGGVHLSQGATLVIQNGTITANTAVSGAGGGIRRGSTGTTIIESSIVANNINASAPDISSGGTVSVDNSAIGAATGFTLSGGTNLPFGIDLKLGPLADNGGPTLTHMLLPGSPAINQGSNPANLATDQRGQARVQGLRADIGAFEAAAPAVVTAVVVNDGAPQRSRVTNLTIQFDRVVTIANPVSAAFKLERQSDGAVVALQTFSPNSTNEVVLNFAGGPLNFGSLADGRYTLTISAAAINGGDFDGNGDGNAGDSFIMIGDPATNKLFRLFGDSNGDGTVTAADFNAFRLQYGTSGPSIFDFNGDNNVSATDFNEFRLRYGAMI